MKEDTDGWMDYEECKFTLAQLNKKMCVDRHGTVYAMCNFVISEKVVKMAEISKGFLRRGTKRVDIGTPEHISKIKCESPKTLGTDWVSIREFEPYDLAKLNMVINRMEQDRERYLEIKKGLLKFGIEIKKVEDEKAIQS